MKYQALRVSAGLALSLLASSLVFPPLSAQTSTGRIEGTIHDESGAVVPGAKVVVTNMRTQVVMQTNADGDGRYIFPVLPNSFYSLTAEAPGFSKAVVSNIELNASSTVVQNIKMEVGSVAETITVEAAAERVNTSDAMIARTVNMREIDTLPQLARSPLAIAVFSPGFSINPGDVTFSRINGTRQGSNNTKLDGIDANDSVVPRFGLSLTSVNTDSVEEMRIVTNGGKAEYGRNAGGQVEMISRSGTNRWSGNGFDYMRNTVLNANQFFNNSSNIARPKLVQNTFGGALGGPIFKDRTFIFGNYQGRRTSQDVVRNRTVLTPEAKRGLFRWTPPGGGGVQSFDIVGNDPRGLGIDRVVAANLALLPDPNNNDVGDGLNTAGFRFNSPAGSLEDQFTIKADHNLWSGHRVFYRFSRQRNSSIDTLNNAEAQYPGLPHGRQGGIRWGYSIGSDWAVRPDLINEFRLGYQSADVAFIRPRPEQPLIISNLFTDPYTSAFPQGRNSPVIDLADNFTHVTGKHAYKMGMTFRRVLQYGYNDAGIYPNINTARTNGNIPPATIGPGGTSISSADRQRFENLYNDLFGRISQISSTFYSNLEAFQPAGVGRIRNTVFKDWGFFFQDDWRLRPNLTLNLGMRYELLGPPVERDALQGTLDKVDAVNASANINNFTVVRQAKWYDTDYGNFAPRIGFAWDPFRDGKTSIRGGYGIFYDRVIGATANAVDGGTPGFSQTVQVFPNSASGADIRAGDNPALPAQPGAPILTQPVTRQTGVYVFKPNLDTGYVQHFDFTIQREIMKNTVVDVGFVRTFGTKLFTWLDLNQPKAYGDFLGAFKELEAFRATGASPSPSNTIVRLFGTPQAAITAIGAGTFQNGLLNTAANTVDRNNFSRYGAALNVNDFYLRNFPQYDYFRFGTNNGMSSYNSLQVSVRRQTGAVKFTANYTFSKSIDNTSVDGNGFTAPYDNFNLDLNRGLGDYDRRHAFNGSAIYSLPVGAGRRFGGDLPKWANKIVGGWDLGALMIWQSGGPFTVSSGRTTAATSATTMANYSGSRNIGEVTRSGNGVTFFTPDQIAQFSFPGPGEIGSSGRNAFHGPRFFNVDMSVVKRFPLFWEHHSITLRGEAYNVFNNTNFLLATTNTSLATTQTFGRISSTVANGARILQVALRYDF